MLYLVVSFLVLISDRASKWIVMERMMEGESIPLVPPVLYLTYVKNSGAAFGILEGRTEILSLIAFFVIALALWHWKKIMRQSKLVRWGFALGFGGAVGNLIDRLRWGGVVDFIDVPFFSIFNIADIAIVLAVALLFWEVLRSGREK